MKLLRPACSTFPGAAETAADVEKELEHIDIRGCVGAGLDVVYGREERNIHFWQLDEAIGEG